MSVLDELREAVKNEAWPKPTELHETEFNAALLHVLELLDAFEQAHPGLVDQTIICDRCHLPKTENPGWLVCHECLGELEKGEGW